MDELWEYIDTCSWWTIGAGAVAVTVLVIGLIVILDGLRNSRARYWGGLALVFALLAVPAAAEVPTVTAFYMTEGPQGMEYAESAVSAWQRLPVSTFGVIWASEALPDRVAGAWWDQMSGAWVYVCLDGEEVGPHGIWTGPPDQLRAIVGAWWSAKGAPR